MFRFTISARARVTIAGVFCFTTLSTMAFGADDRAIPNFSPDLRTGWIAGVQNSDEPIGDDFLPTPPELGPGPVASDKAHPYIDNAMARRTGKQPTNRVADLSNPILQPWVRDELRKLNARSLTQPMLWTPKERCWPIGVPGFLLYPVTPVYFLQTPTKVVLIWEEDHMARHIYLTDKHSENLKPSWFGKSIGHYENGDTLVVDTIGIDIPHLRGQLSHAAYRAVACRRALPSRGRRQGDRSDGAGRGSGRLHDAVDRAAALPAGRAGPDAGSCLRGEQRPIFQLRDRADPDRRQAGFLIRSATPCWRLRVVSTQDEFIRCDEETVG